ncbi:hypothetical protein EJF36_18240 [Bacillus sp. HMF5848]|uniref:S-layer homology domain-containing protein n=1 Tax=Bacillus sp. HMF5848 TaxID=2495421 RepID=UPI000F794B26|nr:S-layer homology domain-containing protein [Bacillus sp. HMF5848]RSK28649.1 hypothetical protein EJF36_18240 [Bacillus sp. HMF5848]
MRNFQFQLISVVLAVLVALAPHTTLASTSFTDVNLYNDEITFLTERGIITGYDDRTFRPTQNIKRMQAVQVIIRHLTQEGITPSTNAPTPQFSDLKPGDYGYDEVKLAVQLGIIDGTRSKFNAWQPLTRDQMAKILVEAYDLTGESQLLFNDVSTSHWAQPYIATLAGNNITTGYDDNTFRPRTNMSRQHFAVFMARMLDDRFKQDASTPADLTNITTLEKNVVMVHALNYAGQPIAQASGFFIGNGIVMTTASVFETGNTFVITDSDGVQHELLGYVDKDTNLDVAVVKTAKPIPRPGFPLVAFSNLEKGDRVIAIGSPQGIMNTVSDGIISGLHDNDEDYVDIIQISIPLSAEHAGAPILNEAGQLVGIALYGEDDGSLHFALPTDYVHDMIANTTNMPYENTGFSYFSRDTNVKYTTVAPDMNLPFMVKDVVQQPNSSILYALSEHSDIVYKIDYDKQTIETHNLAGDVIPVALEVHNGEVFILYKKITNNAAAEIVVLNANTLEQTRQFPLLDLNDEAIENPFDLVVHDDYVYVSTGERMEYLFAYNHQLETRVSQHFLAEEYSTLAISEDGTKVFATDYSKHYDDAVEVYEVDKGQIKGLSNFYRGEFGKKASLHGKYVYGTNGVVFDAATRTKQTQFHIPYYDDIAFGMDRIYVGTYGILETFDASTHKLLNRVNVPGQLKRVFSSNGTAVVISEVLENGSNRPKHAIYKINGEESN